MHIHPKTSRPASYGISCFVLLAAVTLLLSGLFVSAAVAADRTEASFRQLDGNQDGWLSGTEMRGLESLDTDGNNRVTMEEYLAGNDGSSGSGDTIAVIPESEQLFMIDKDDVVRLYGQGIAGSTATAEVRGPAKVTRTFVLRYTNGNQVRIGGMQKEFEITPTGTGDVTVIITVTFPTTPGQPQVTMYRFRVRGEPTA